MEVLWTPSNGNGSGTRRVLLCTICGKKFPTDQRQQHGRHVSRCAKKHEGEIQQLVADRADAFTGPSDKEMHQWVRRKTAELGNPDEANKRLRGRRGR